jgi:serine/threonine-protein kinase
MNLAPEFVVADRFRLISLIGQGGMGAVWLAQHLSLDVRCAVKFIHPEVARSPGLLARFEREAKAIAQIQGRHVVKVYDRGVWRGIAFIAMEYLVGEDLNQRLRRVTRLSPLETFTMLSDVCRALSRAHAIGLVHRDLKPGNIFLFQDDDREIAKVLDFGIAKDTTIAPDVATQAGALLGTPYYMSPEQWRADRVLDARSDLWSLGVIAFQCLTGQLPFSAHALGELFMKVLIEPIPVPSHFAQVPPGFDAWWARAMQRDPALRYQSARDAMVALGEAFGLSPNGVVEYPATATVRPAAGPVTAGSPGEGPVTAGSSGGGLLPAPPVPEVNTGNAEDRPPFDMSTVVLTSFEPTSATPPGPQPPLAVQDIPGVPKHAQWPWVAAGVVGACALAAGAAVFLRSGLRTAYAVRSAQAARATLSATVTTEERPPVEPPVPDAGVEPAVPTATPTPAVESARPEPPPSASVPVLAKPMPKPGRPAQTKTERRTAPDHGSEGIY